MIYDSLGGMTPLNTLDIRLEKKQEAAEPRTVEDTGDSNESTMDMDEQNIAKTPSSQTVPKKVDVELETYNDRGDLQRKVSSEQPAAPHQTSINLFV